MERDHVGRLADLAVAMHNAEHADQQFFSAYLGELRRSAW